MIDLPIEARHDGAISEFVLERPRKSAWFSRTPIAVLVATAVRLRACREQRTLGFTGR